MEDDALHFPVSIRVTGQPRRRVAGTFDRRFDSSDADRIARAYLEQLEAAVVLQAVGRIRYATSPRMVVTIQAGELRGVQLTREFSSLRELRSPLRAPDRLTGRPIATGGRGAPPAERGFNGRGHRRTAGNLGENCPLPADFGQKEG